MNRIARNFQIILRSEKLIASRQVAVATRKGGLFGAAALMGGIAVVFLNVAAYLVLAARLEPAMAALIVASANLVLAGILIALAKGMSADRDVEAVSEVRDMAMADLEGELQEATDEIRELAQNVRKMTRDPFSSASLSVIGPLLSLLLKNLKK
ncbi:phage holin family protein [Aliiruegeria sabulilitoris]|uniref:phage holin family protein n=1 Tax=Aliiruegeria sabulilitoris TaxID=1510458 RepID=UPI00082B528F|nr:phage holin family protein [Aliiruegeria sabulilitoris]NDR59146.1 phage holin family protein [Pseudoruegeria sp. M32A2M]